MSSKQIELPEIGKVKLTKRRGNRNIRLSYASSGEIRVSLPHYVPYQAGIAFVKGKKDWLDKHRPEKPVLLDQFDKIGKAHRMDFVFKQTTRPSVRVTDNIIRVNLPVGMNISSKLAQSTASRGAHKALSLEASNLLPQRLKILAEQHGFRYNSVAVKRLVSRWGSCSQHKDIVLNTYLMQLSWDLIDYVILHELVHTEHLNHSAEFWQRFEEIKPKAKALRKQLKSHRTVIQPQ